MTTVSLGKTQTNLTSLPHNKRLPSYMRETQSIYLKVILTSYHSLFFYSFSFLSTIYFLYNALFPSYLSFLPLYFKRNTYTSINRHGCLATWIHFQGFGAKCHHINLKKASCHMVPRTSHYMCIANRH